ncbi:MAG: DotU family type IV/VI secretion system protein [Ignavibacteriota bacterium]
MTPSTATGIPTTRTDNLALIFQEVLTAIVRLRTNRQELSDAESFRFYMREAIKSAIQEARNHGGYNAEDIRWRPLPSHGFLDESVLNLRNPMFADWPRKPLQEELFGIHMAGEIFFRNLEQLMGRNDSADLADLLEVHYLCLLLGYGGRYSIGGKGELQAITNACGERIKRIRGASYDPFMEVFTEPEIIKVTEDPWVKKFVIITLVCFVLMVGLFITFKLTLGSRARRDPRYRGGREALGEQR